MKLFFLKILVVIFFGLVVIPLHAQWKMAGPSDSESAGYLNHLLQQTTSMQTMAAPITSSMADNRLQAFAKSFGTVVPGTTDTSVALRIYEWVRNNIEYQPYQLHRRGPYMAWVERAGNDFDQGILLATLLQKAGYDSVECKFASVNAPLADVAVWLGVDESLVGKLLETIFYQLAAGYLPSVNGTVVTMPHMWVELSVGGSIYKLTPAYKPADRPDQWTNKPNIVQWSGYSQSEVLSKLGAASGNNFSTTTTAINNLRNLLGTYAKSLEQGAGASAGGSWLAGHPSMRQEMLAELPVSLPDAWQPPSIIWSWPVSAIPIDCKTFIQIKDLLVDVDTDPKTQNHGIWQIATCDLVGAMRLYYTTGASGSTTAALSINGVTANGYDIASAPSDNNISQLEIAFINCKFPSFDYQAFYQGLAYTFAFNRQEQNYTIDYGFGRTRRRLDDYLANTPPADMDSNDNRYVIGMQHQAAIEEFYKVFGGISNSICLLDLHAGIVGVSGSPFVDMPLNIVHSFPREAATGHEFESNRLFVCLLYWYSAMEHLCFEQAFYPATSVSTVKLLQENIKQGKPVYLVSGTPQFNNLCNSNTLEDISDAQKSSIASIFPYGKALIPKDFSIGIGDYNGTGYMLVTTGTTPSTSNYIGGVKMEISGGLNGGFVTTATNTNIIETNKPTQTAFAPNANTPTPVTLPVKDVAEPVDAGNGAYYKNVTDLVIGDGRAPLGLAFSRHYSSARRHSDPMNLGRGWTHSYNIRAVERHPLDFNLDRASVAEVAPLIIAAKAIYDIYDYHNGTAREWLVPALVACWGAEQLVNSRMSVMIGEKTYEFVKRHDGTFAPPPGVDATLVRETDGSHTLQFYKGLQIKFRASDGRFTSITDTTLGANGPSLTASYNYIYNGTAMLTAVTDAFQRYIQFNYLGARLASVTDSTGRTVSYENVNNIYTTTDATGATDKMYYDSAFRVTRLEDALGNIILTSSYNVLNQVASQKIYNDSGRYWEVGAAGGSTRQTDPYGNSQWLYFDSSGRPWAEVDELGNATITTYDGADRITSVTSPENRTTSFTYDAHHQVTGITDPAGETISITPTDATSSTTGTMRDREGNVTTTTYYANHRVKDITQPGGEKTEFTYDDKGRVKKIHPASYAVGKWIEYAYTDVSGTGTVKITGTYPDNTIERAWLSSAGDVIQTVDRNGRRTTTTYDANRRPLTVARWSGSYSASANPSPSDTPPVAAIVTSCSYNAVGDLVSVTDAKGHSTAFAYNALGDLETVTDASGVVQAENGYDLRNKLALTTGAITGQEVSRVYDAAGRLTSLTDPLQRTSLFAYDNDGLLTAASSPGDSTTATLHDALGNPATIEDPLQQTIHQTHDKDSRPTALRNRRGKTYATAYNLAGRVTTSTTPLGFQTVVNASTRGLVTNVTLPSGRVAENTVFDDEGRVLTQVVKDATGAVVATRNYTYLPGGPILTVTEITATGTTTTTREYDGFYRLASYNDGNGGTIAYEYDKADNLTKLTYPDNTFVTYEYDVCNRLIKVTDWAGRETGYGYDTAGRLTTTTRPNGTVRTQMYDLAGQIRLIEERGPSNELLWLRACKYDLNGNIIETITSPTETTNWTLSDDTLTYDADNRLATWNSFAVTHDADGNMTNGPLPDGTGAVHTYDMFDRLASVGGVASTYNPDGLRVRAGGVSYVVDPNGGLSKPLLRQQGGTVTKYVWGLGLLYEVTGTATKTYHADHLGSTVALTNASGAVIDRWEYSSYGTQTYRTGTSDTPFQFHGLLGCMTDANGLVYMRARYYNPRLMRFLNADPIGFDGGMNWYAFVGNNPIIGIDPSGLLWTDSKGNEIPATELKNIKEYIFYNSDFREQALVQYNRAIQIYGKGTAALSLTSTDYEFMNDWVSMYGQIAAVKILTHGMNQSISLSDGARNQLTSTGDNLTNISRTRVMNIQDLPAPIGDISKAILDLYSCHAMDRRNYPHEGQGKLSGSMEPVGYAFSKFDFMIIRGSSAYVNYESFWTTGTPRWSKFHLQPYPSDGKWVTISPKAYRESKDSHRK